MDLSELQSVKSLSKEERLKKVGRAAAVLTKKYGENKVFMGQDMPEYLLNIGRLSLGNVVLDNLTGGGIPRGRFTHVYGPPGVGKSTLLMDAMALAQQNDGIVALVDAEHVFDGLSMEWARSRGINIDELIISKPETDEEALDCILEFAKSGAVDLCIFDSVAALSPKAEAERDIEQDTMALKARLNSKFFRKGTAINSLSQMATVFINQVRTDLGSYGSPDTTSGGRAIHFYASLELGLRRAAKAEWPKEGDTYTGYQLITKINKTKISGTGVEGTECKVNFNFKGGIDPKEAVIFLAVEQGVIRRDGEKSPFYVIDMPNSEPFRIKGKDNVLGAVRDNDELYTVVLNKVNSLIK